MTRPATPDAGAPPELAGRRLQYEGFPLESVLQRVHAAHGADATICAADRVRRGGVAGFFAREVFQVTVFVPDEEPAGTPLGSIDLRDQSPHDDDSDADFDTDDIDPEDIEGALGLTVASPREGSDADMWDLLAAAAGASQTTAAAEAGPTRLAERPQVVEPIRSQGPIASTTLIPAAAIAPVRLGELISDLEATLSPPPEVPTAGIVAVVGARREALEVAGRLAAELGVAPDDVVVAAPSVEVVIPTEQDTMRLAATTRYRCRPIAVIAVELVAGRQGHEWARAVLDGLRAEQVRFAADAGRLLDDQHLSMAALGGVDAVDVLGATSHPNPAELLAVSAPIATLDGRVAGPEMWAATLLATGSAGALTVNRSSAGAR